MRNITLLNEALDFFHQLALMFGTVIMLIFEKVLFQEKITRL